MTARAWAPPPELPAGMSRETWRRLQRLPEATRVRVLERASILHEAVPFADWDWCDERALAEEASVGTQKALVGT